MSIEIQIRKQYNTCIILNAKIYYPEKTGNKTDYYNLPCEKNEVLNISFIHYSGDEPFGITSVIQLASDNKIISFLKEIKSFNINLCFCRFDITLTAKKEAILILGVSKIFDVDRVSNSLFCRFCIVQSKNISIVEKKMCFYPAQKTKRLTFAIEFAFQFVVLIAVFVFFLSIIDDCLKSWNSLHISIGPYPIFIAVIPAEICLVVLMVLWFLRVKKRVLDLD